MKDFYRSCRSVVLCAMLAVICHVTTSTAIAAPITWTGKSPMPTARSRAASGVVNGKIFVLGGNIGGSTTVEMYDAAKDTWQSWPPLAEPIYAPCQVTLGDTIYMVGMNSSQVIAYRTFIHAGSPNPLPVPPPYGSSDVVGTINTIRSSRAQAALVDKKMYIVGTGPNMDQIEEFDLTTYTSITKNTRLPAGRDLPMVTAFEGRIYIMGGINGGAATTTIWQYDPVADNIFPAGSLPSPMAGNMVATWGGKIYIAGANTNGASPPAWDGTLWEYDVRGGFWNSFDAAPTSRYAAAVQIWNGSLYVIGGDSGGDSPSSLATNEAARLPSGSPRWTIRDTNTPPVVHPSIATVDGKIFMLGGRTSVNFMGQSEVYSFDPAAPFPTWQRMPDLAAPILAAPAAVHGQKIYLAGGESPTGSTASDIQYYDTATVPHTAGMAASLRYPRAKAGAAILNNRMYIIGGGTAAIEEFDLTTTPITRTERVDYLPEPLFQPSVVSANGRIYIMGGMVATGPAANTITDACLIYDPMAPYNTFAPCATLPVALDENEGAAVIDGKIYLVSGGTNGLYSPDTTSAVQKYDPLTDSWEVSDTMTTPRRDHGIAYTNGHIYVMGGWLNGGGYWANTTEEYTVPFIWRVNSYSGDAVDWPGSLHGTVPTGSYLLIGGKYYFVRASYAGSWNGPGFNMAVLQQCDQYSGEPLYDPANPGMPLAPDLSATVFQSIDLVTSWQPRTRPSWNVTSIDPGSVSGIDWPASVHGPVTPGTYLQVGATVYYVMASGPGSWHGGDYVYAYLYNCDQATGQITDYGANMTGSVGATISTYTFAPQQFTVTATATGNGTINCDSPVTAGGSSICTITPATGHVLQGLTDNGVDARAGVVNNLYTISNVSTDHTIAATFEPTTGASSLWTWGYNYHGQLGDGTNQDKATAMQIPGFNDVRSIAGGMAYSIALKWDGTVWGWGDNYDGGLGNGTFDNINTPQQNPYLSNVKTIATGWFHTLALKNDDTVWRWGSYNRYDPAMADINSLNSNIPVEVSGLTGVIALAGGENHSLALKADGTVWAWGGNVKGQLGTGYFNNSTVPVQVTNLDNVIAIAAGVSHSVALKADGTVWTWGYNASGQLGDGTTLDSPIPVQVQGLATVTAIAGGHDHTVALKADGTVWAWGLNMDGQLGDGTTTNSSIPVQAIGLAGVTAIDAECRSTFALRADGTVWEWGTYYVNQVFKNDPVPVQVPGLTGITAIAGGMDHRIALKGGDQQGNWTVNSSSYGLIDWLASQHETVSYRNYLKINNTYYFVNGSWSESWNGSQYNVADLLECDQTSGRILYLNPFQPRQPNLAGAEGQAITLFTSWPGSEEANPLQLMTTSPDAVATGFPIGNPITVTFSAPIDPASVNASTFGVRRWDVGGPVGAFMSGSWSSNGATAIFTPSEPLSHNTRYLAAIVDVLDQTGNHQAFQYNWSFTTAAAAPVISVSPSFFDFGVMQVLSSSSPLFTISNTGTAPLTVNSTSIGGSQPADFFVSPYTCTSLTPTLAPGASCTVAVNFIPTGTGTVSASLQIGSDDAATPLVTVPLTATVVPQNHSLYLSFSGTGNGSISFSTGDNCSGTCNPSFPAGTVVSLTPTAIAGSLFTGWTGCDSVAGDVCTVTMSNTRSVTATFDLSGPPAPVWTTKAPMPTGLSRAYSATVNGSIYILGGSPSTAAVQRYNPQTDTWTQQAPLPTPLFGGAAAAQGTTIYLAGGFNSAMTFQDAILAYDTVTGSTSQVGILTTPRARMNGTILNNRLYVVGGSNALDTIEAFDLGTGSSSIVATLPEPTELAAVIGNLTDLYIFGGGSDNTKSWRFDTLSNTFHPMAPSPQPVKARAATFDNGRILLVDVWAYNGSNSVLEYSFPLDRWSIATSVPTLRDVPMVEAVDGVLYVMGGDSAGTMNEAWRFADNPVTTHVVTPVAGPNGGITPATPQTVADGATTSFAIQPYPGYHIDAVSGCGGSLSGTTFTTGPITTDCTVSATFVQNNPAELCSTVDMVWFNGGTEIRRDYNCASGQQSASGYCYSFPTDACSGYRCVAGNTITPACYSETECTASCNGTCVQIPTMRQTCSSPGSTYTVTPVPGQNGSISPATPQTVNAGATMSFTIQPYPGYHISSITGCGGTLSGTTYTTGQVLASCTVNAFFAADSAGDSCTSVDMVWLSGGTEIRRDYNCASAQQSPSGYCYSYQTDACSGYRCVTGNQISPACYSESQCSEACGGQCVQIPTQKAFCASAPVSYPVLVTINGSGTVHSSVAPDLNCSSGTCSQSYPGGTSLQLTASPAAGFDFAGWVGCDSVAGAVCNLGSIGAAKRVTATFALSGTPAFTQAAGMTVAREFHSATLLPDGKVLIAGGWPGLATSELYDPATDTWSPAGNLAVGRHSHTATLLPNGKVLVAGGYPNKVSAEIYDPATNSWSTARDLTTGRSAHTATLLTSGKVLVAAGYDPIANLPLASAELYDPATDLWTSAGNLANARQWHSATILPDGKALVVGGSTTHSAMNSLSSAELYDPATNNWSPAGNLANSRQQHTSTLLASGKVLVTGGWGSGGMQATTEIYDPATGGWTSAASMAKARFFHGATALPDGKVLVTGGHIATYEENGPLASAELYDPVIDSWSSAGDLAYPRRYHSQTLLPDGRTLIVGGSNNQGALTSAEIFGIIATAHSLTVTLTGSGQGTVHSSPAPDITCLSGVCSQSYTKGTVVTLTATPANGFTFAGWGDDCSGTGQCQVTMNAGKIVKAQFAASGDTIQPTVTTFVMPASAGTLTVPVTTFLAGDNIAVTGYLISESASPPAAGATGWSGSPPANFTFLAPGNCYAYAWAKDGAGNVSAAGIAMVNITIPDPVDTLAPIITSFTLGSSGSLTAPIILAVTDNVGVAGYLVTEDPTIPLSGDSRWLGTPPSSYTFATYGNKTLYAWAKDASENISAGVMATTIAMDPAETLDTVITGWPANPMPYSPSSFTFIASRTSAGFECSLDNQGYFPCSSPISFGSLANGSHTFSVRAKDGGVTDDTPATFTWTVQVPLVQVLLNTYSSVLDAYLAIADGASLKIKGIEFREDLVFDRPVAVTLQGGYDAAYLNTDGSSVIHGSISIGQGTVTIDNITII